MKIKCGFVLDPSPTEVLATFTRFASGLRPSGRFLLMGLLQVDDMILCIFIEKIGDVFSHSFRRVLDIILISSLTD